MEFKVGDHIIFQGVYVNYHGTIIGIGDPDFVNSECVQVQWGNGSVGTYFINQIRLDVEKMREKKLNILLT